MKKVLILLLLIFSSMAVFSSDLIIDSKTQTFSDKEKKIKLDGGVKVKLDNLTVESDRADVTIRRNNKLDTATFYDKPYAYEVNENKKREVKANILKVSLINKVVRAEGEAQSIITEGNTPIVVINADTQEYDINSSVMVCTGGVTMKYKDIDKEYGTNLCAIGKATKKFDFVFKSPSNNELIVMEVNFYGTQGSKPNETAKSYVELNNEINKLNGVKFVWITDGNGWNKSRLNLEDAYDKIEHLYTIKDLELGVLEKI